MRSHISNLLLWHRDLPTNQMHSFMDDIADNISGSPNTSQWLAPSVADHFGPFCNLLLAVRKQPHLSAVTLHRVGLHSQNKFIPRIQDTGKNRFARQKVATYTPLLEVRKFRSIVPWCVLEIVLPETHVSACKLRSVTSARVEVSFVI